MTGETEGRKSSILLIEDNPADVELFRYVLESAQVRCDLIVIDDGGEALAFVQQRGKYQGVAPPSLAIVDLNLPRYDGMEILEAMRANPAFAGVPVVVMSSSSSPRDRLRIEEPGIGRYITKPPDLDGYLQVGLTLKAMLEGVAG